MTSHDRTARIAALALTFLMAAGAVRAGEIDFGGAVAVGFGWLRLESESPATSAPDGIGEVTVNVSASKGPMSARLELGIAESASEPDAAEYELSWAITDELELSISGSSFGIESAEGNTSVINAPAAPVGDEEAFLDFSETGLMNIEYTAGVFTVGLGLSDACLPDCGFGHFQTADEQTVEMTPQRETRSVVVHLRGQYRELSFNLYATASRGSFLLAATDALLAGRGRGEGLGLAYRINGLALGLDVARAVEECNPGAVGKDNSAVSLPSPCTAEREISKIAASVANWGLGVRFLVAREEVGSTREDTSNVDLVYLFPVMQATVGPEYRWVTSDRTGEPETTDSIFLFGMSIEF